MIQKLPMFFLSICALLLYADAMPQHAGTRKRTSAMQPEEVSKMFEKPTKSSKKMPKKSVEIRPADLGRYDDASEQHTDNVRPKVNIGQHVEQPGTPQIEEHKVAYTSENIGLNDVEQSGTPQVEEHAVASTSEIMDPKGQLEELLEMNETLIWEMALRSEDEQITMAVRSEDEQFIDSKEITDLEVEQIIEELQSEDELITDLEVEQIIEELQSEDELITDLEADSEDDTDPDNDLLQWFPAFIFIKLEKFLPNVPEGDGQHKAKLTKLVASRKAEIEHTAQIKQIENSLDTYRREMRERIMPGVKLTSPVVKIFLDHGFNESHDEEKKAFLSKMSNKMPTSYANKFFGGIEIATTYLKQAVKIGEWAQNNHFLTSAQLENLPKFVENNLSELANLRQAMAAKLGIDLAEIGMPQLLAQSSPSLDNIFTRNLSEKHAEIKDIAQREKAKINDAQIAALHLFTALSAASAEVAALEAELLGIKITWRAFQTVGDVSKMAQILQQIR